MADIKIRIDTDTATLKSLRDELKRLKVELQGIAPGTAAFKEGAGNVATLDVKVKEADASMRGMTGAVRTARAENRLFKFVLVELIGGLEGMASVFGTVTGASESSKKAIKGFADSAKLTLEASSGVGFALFLMGGSFAALAGPIGIAVAVVVAFSEILRKVIPDAEKLKKTMDEIADIKLETGQISAQTRINQLLVDQTKLIGERSNMMRKIPIGGFGPTDEDVANMDKRIVEIDAKLTKLYKEQTDKKDKALKEQEDREKKSDEFIKKLDTDIAKDKIAGIENKTAKALAIAIQDRETRRREAILEIDDERKLKHTLFEIEIEFQRKIGEIRPKWPERLKAAKVPVGKETESFGEKIAGQFDIGLEANKAFTDAALTGLSQIGAQVDILIGRNFRAVFGEANSALEIFVQAFLSSLTQIAVQILAIQALKLIPGVGGILSVLGYQRGGIIPEPVVGMGLRSGRPYTFAERGPELVVPNVNSNVNVKPVFIIRNQITARGLATFVESGDRINSRARY